MYKTEKEQLIEIFHERVKGRTPDVSSANARHDGRRGHWLERQFGVAANGDNSADILGYELKNETTSNKTTFGDWSPNYFIFKDPAFFDCFDGQRAPERQDSFVRIFGKRNIEKGGRYSWSGQPIPKINRYNDFGEILLIESNEDIVILYSFTEDKRPDKYQVVPVRLQVDNLEIARWFGKQLPLGARGKTLREKLEDKFDQNGWFTCKTNANGVYDKICFGSPVNYDKWLELVKEGIVYFDSGMYETNSRPYCQWRANNSYWDSLIYEIYE